ncbi:Crp/Fnr family transcriptional regulator [Aurantimonas sp. Leaf443]|uniref:Crp/Fnr family transcriptional regulator n=1 Tax=Aurantimonas sp. Leaf443 TaxID=1736378 RepID=UPI0006F6558D|nr:Crp/Fnr family transcriptional regulator [Aurantimonas sp. Leaf443]KQT85261.1 CarD family transcriptional regulator [Aurantimonas sp. Leaf443]
MPGPVPTAFRNRLLKALPERTLAALAPLLEPVTLPRRDNLAEPEAATPAVTFIEMGLASVVATGLRDGETVEVAHIGPEGVAGFHLLLGVDRAPSHTFMLVPGTGLKASMADVTRMMDEDREFRRLMLRYVHVTQLQISYSVLANGRYTLAERLARWLLMCHDRLEEDEMALTHQFLAQMLGVRRSGVTNEIHVLEGGQVIKATRGSIRILDRPRLEARAGGSYGVPEREYRRVIEGERLAL